MSNVHVKSDKLHTLMVTFHVLFDIYKILSIEFHRRDSADFVQFVLHVVMVI